MSILPVYGGPVFGGKVITAARMSQGLTRASSLLAGAMECLRDDEEAMAMLGAIADALADILPPEADARLAHARAQMDELRLVERRALN